MVVPRAIANCRGCAVGAPAATAAARVADRLVEGAHRQGGEGVGARNIYIGNELSNPQRARDRACARKTRLLVSYR